MAATSAKVFILAVFLYTSLVNAGLSSTDYNKWFQGEGTYFGGGKRKWQVGNCAFRAPRPSWFNNYVPVAMNNQQYYGMCGACVQVIGSSKGLGANPISGRFNAIIMDRCPKCKKGDIDLARDGNGRWKVKWKIIPCAKQGPIEFQFEGSNPFYHKVQPRNLRSPVKKVRIGGIEAQAKHDNHWVAQNRAGFLKPTKIEVWTVLGAHITVYVNSHSDGVVRPTKVSRRVGMPPPKKNKKPSKPTRNPIRKPARQQIRKPGHGRCVPVWHHCRGFKNKWGTSHCCSGHLCVYRNKHGYKCVPRQTWRRRCVPQWRNCRGYHNTWGTSQCCDGYKCVRNFGRHSCVRPQHCRRARSYCGFGRRWTTWQGKVWPGIRCCAHGTTCKRYGSSLSFFCMP